MLDDLVEDQDVERPVGEREVLALRGHQVGEAGLGQALSRDVEAVHPGAEVAEPAYVGADPAPHVEDAAILEGDVSPDQLEPPLLPRAPHVARLAEPGRIGRWRALDVVQHWDPWACRQTATW